MHQHFDNSKILHSAPTEWIYVLSEQTMIFALYNIKGERLLRGTTWVFKTDYISSLKGKKEKKEIINK